MQSNKAFSKYIPLFSSVLTQRIDTGMPSEKISGEHKSNDLRLVSFQYIISRRSDNQQDNI